ncbi:MAG TPA: ABC transporter ATP-binding protein [Spirochaetia bacterium]|nr:ABC transporter ATP-binding protein [Spirochaetia bacterium]
MGFILDGLETESYDRQYSDRTLIRRILAYFRPHRGKMMLLVLTLALNSIAGTAAPILISRAIDVVSRNSDLRTIAILSVAVLLLGVLAWVFNYIRQKSTAEVIGDVVLTLRSEVLERTVQHDMSFFDEHPSGKMVSRITSDTQDFSNTVTLVVEFVSEFLLVAVLAVWLININWWLTLILVAMAPVAVAIALSFRRLARKVTQNARRATAVINSHIQESVSGIMVAKTFRQEKTLYSGFGTNNRLAYRVGLRRGIVLNLIFPLMGIAAGVGNGLLAYTGGIATRGAGMTPGDWYLFMQAVGFFWWPLLSIASFWSQFQDGLSAAERAFALIDAEPVVRQTDSQPLETVAGEIEFRNVRFSYSDKETVLTDFSLHIGAGETVAFVGHTGAGKSSIARLVARFYEFQAGTILVDGRDIRSIDLGDYRKRIGLVPQDPFLFSGTVADNIRYGNALATEDDVRAAAAHVGNGDWLSDLPNGLETAVGERGASISLGQRQLVALARVLLKNPAIFILDEATASVDPFTETQIQEGLATVMKERTAIVIAHRLSTVKTADRIVVLQKGQIIEQGTHEGLLASGGHYSELYNTYFRHQSLEYIESFGRGEEPESRD